MFSIRMGRLPISRGRQRTKRIEFAAHHVDGKIRRRSQRVGKWRYIQGPAANFISWANGAGKILLYNFSGRCRRETDERLFCTGARKAIA